MVIGSKELRLNVSEYLNRAGYGKERIVVTRSGKPVAALIPLDDLQALEAIEDQIDVEAARKALAEAEEQGYVDWEELKTELGLAAVSSER